MNKVTSIYREAVSSLNRHLRGINEKYKNDDLVADGDVRTRYNTELVSFINEKLLEYSVHQGFSFKQAQDLLVTFNKTTGMFDLKPVATGTLFMEPERDQRGFVVRVWLPEAYIEQSDLETKEFLSHYGVKGMKWGVRKSRNEKERAETFGPSKDAKNRSRIQTKAKNSGLDALTNQEMQTAINRMNLEVNYSRLNEQTRKKSRGEKMVNFLIKDVAEVEVQRVVKSETTKAVNKAIKKREAAQTG